MAYPQELSLAQLIESKLNPRKTFIESEIAEIAESAAADAGGKPRGILEPLIVRPTTRSLPNDGAPIFEIIAGSKRYRAAKRASLPFVPVRVMEMTDQQVLEAMLIENLQRSDPHPLEEAEGYARLLKMPAYTADVLAEKVGKDRSYIYKRIQLTELIEPLKGKFLEGKINIGHALQLCRLQEADQIMVGKEGLFFGYGADREATSVERLREFIERNVFLKLSTAPWDKDDAGLLPAAGSCTKCQKRTGANLVLFDDAGKDDRCLDRKCFHSKQAALIQISIAKAGEKGIELVKVAKGWKERQKKHAAGIVVDGDYQEAVKSKCAKPESAIVVAGEDVGKKFQLCRQRGCKHHGYSSAHRSPARTAADVWKEKERRLNGEIESQADQRVALAIIGKVETLGMHEYRAIARELLDGIGDEDTAFLAKAVGIEVKLPEKKRQVYGHGAAYKAVADHIGVCPPKTLARIIVGSIILGGSIFGKDRLGFEEPYKVDRKAIGKRVAAELRTAFKAEKTAALAKAKKPAAGKKAKAAAK